VIPVVCACVVQSAQKASNRGFISAAKEYQVRYGVSEHVFCVTALLCPVELFVPGPSHSNRCSRFHSCQAGEELTFDYGLLNDAVLAYYGQPTPDCRGLKR
jgi:hypothetical protein